MKVIVVSWHSEKAPRELIPIEAYEWRWPSKLVPTGWSSDYTEVPRLVASLGKVREVCQPRAVIGLHVVGARRDMEDIWLLFAETKGGPRWMYHTAFGSEERAQRAMTQCYAAGTDYYFWLVKVELDTMPEAVT